MLKKAAGMKDEKSLKKKNTKQKQIWKPENSSTFPMKLSPKFVNSASWNLKITDSTWTKMIRWCCELWPTGIQHQLATTAIPFHNQSAS